MFNTEGWICERGISPYGVERKPEIIKFSGLKQLILGSYSIKILYMYIDAWCT